MRLAFPSPCKTVKAHSQNSDYDGRVACPKPFFLPALLLAAGLLLAACQPASNVPVGVPTLAPSLALDAPVSSTITPSLTLEFQPIESAPEGAPDEVSTRPMSTLTPWPTSSATPGPSPTRTRMPTVTRVPTRTRAPTQTPTITLTPTPNAPVINLVRPGLMSKVVSPIQMELYAVSGHKGSVTIELVGEDGRVISRKLIHYGNEGRAVWDIPELPFEIEAAAELARLQVSTYDSFNRLIDRSSVDLLLLGVGRSEINPPAVVQAPYLLRQPRKSVVITGGIVKIEALARPINDSPLIIELVKESGQVIAVKRVEVPDPTGALSHTPFSLDLPYAVKTTTPVRLVIRQEGSRIPGTVAQTSILVTLEP